jgi:hypothetical protein
MDNVQKHNICTFWVCLSENLLKYYKVLALRALGQV